MRMSDIRYADELYRGCKREAGVIWTFDLDTGEMTRDSDVSRTGTLRRIEGIDTDDAVVQINVGVCDLEYPFMTIVRAMNDAAFFVGVE